MRVGFFEVFGVVDVVDGIVIEEVNMDVYRWKKKKIGVSFVFYVLLFEYIWILLFMWIFFEIVLVIWIL